ncbi:hypothetical protein HPP92_012240 [Vanilla planifolia]|uniref:HMA domain-containing protein n=1 Tax=Vanilla planifolia TaxID=51239 RepID=A0A835R7C6_VANPL|nr:hypothetical protein HPP92_012240 [Vanilla planifolia]
MTTMIITVNLECHICIKKIKKAIGKLQERNDIKSFEYDEKKGIITIPGKFDQDVIRKKLCSTACEAIIDIQEKPDNPPPPRFRIQFRIRILTIIQCLGPTSQHVYVVLGVDPKLVRAIANSFSSRSFQLAGSIDLPCPREGDLKLL